MLRFCAAIHCMDGRVQVPVLRHLQARFGADCVDNITEPGPNLILAAGTDTAAIESILRRVRISIEQHGSVGIAVVGHYDCAANPAPEAEQNRQTAAVARLEAEFDGVPVIGLWVGERWTVHELDAVEAER